MSEFLTRVAAVRQAQAILSGGSRLLRQDGIWGPRTESVYQSSDEQTREGVVEFLHNAGWTLDEVRSQTVSSKVQPTRSTDEIVEKITAVAQSEGVPPEAAIRFAQVESRLNPNARSATGAAGLFQLTGPAIKQIGIQPPKGNRFDIDWNILVGVKYMKWVANFLNLDFSDVGGIYAGYNLGVGNVKKLQAGKFSDKAMLQALKWQAAPLRKGGPEQYLANARQFVTSTA